MLDLQPLLYSGCIYLGIQPLFESDALQGPCKNLALDLGCSGDSAPHWSPAQEALLSLHTCITEAAPSRPSSAHQHHQPHHHEPEVPRHDNAPSPVCHSGSHLIVTPRLLLCNTHGTLSAALVTANTTSPSNPCCRCICFLESAGFDH